MWRPRGGLAAPLSDWEKYPCAGRDEGSAGYVEYGRGVKLVENEKGR